MSHTDTGQAQIIFFHWHEYCPHVTANMYQMNNCWYLNQSYLETVYRVWGCINKIFHHLDNYTTINSLIKASEYKLWHQQLLYPGHTCMDHIHKCVDGVPQLKWHNFHTCPICQESKITPNYNHRHGKNKADLVGEIFSTDFWFVKGKVDNCLVSSHDGYSSYILIIHHKTRYTRVLLTKTRDHQQQW